MFMLTPQVKIWTVLPAVVTVPAVCFIIVLSFTAVVFALLRKKHQHRDLKTNGGPSSPTTSNVEKLRKSGSIWSNHAHASVKCVKVPVFPNGAYAVCSVGSKTKAPKHLEVKMSPNKAYGSHKIPGCTKIPVYPNEVYAVSNRNIKEPVYELVV